MIKSSQIPCDMVSINADNPFHIDPENKPDQSLKWLEVMESIKIQKRADHRASEMALHNSKKYQMLGLPNLGAMTHIQRAIYLSENPIEDLEGKLKAITKKQKTEFNVKS
jgi:hypothetical protein